MFERHLGIKGLGFRFRIFIFERHLGIEGFRVQGLGL